MTFLIDLRPAGFQVRLRPIMNMADENSAAQGSLAYKADDREQQSRQALGFLRHAVACRRANLTDQRDASALHVRPATTMQSARLVLVFRSFGCCSIIDMGQSTPR